MPVLFKFRSSVGFDSVDLGGRPSISVRDLRARVVEQKNLQICADSLLVVSDAGTGEAYEDEEFMIPDGSSVIIKRVPAGPENCGAAGTGHAAGQEDFLGVLVSSPSETLRHWRLCLIYREFILYSDHEVLKYINGQQMHNARHAKWVEYLLSFTFSIRHKARHHSQVVDALSRRHIILATFQLKDIAMDNFDDFGNDLFPALGAPLQDSDSDESINSFTRRKREDGRRCSESPASRCQNLERSNLSEAFSKENVGENYDNECGAKDNKKQSNLHQKEEGHQKLDEAVDESYPAVPSTDVPSELRCFLCYKIFNEAVMIPCCQHSFCDKCIRMRLVDKGCCPKCSSTKCRIEDLLPNLSLRHAIEHFLEAQIPIIGSDKVTPRYAPDGESGIQAKEASCAVSIRQLEQTLPHSPSVTGKGSNLVIAESACESLTGIKRVRGTGLNIFSLDADKPAKSIILVHKDTRLNEKDDAQEELKRVPRFEDNGNFTKLPQILPQKEGASLTTKKKKGLFATSADASGTILPPSRLKKGERNCFMCGSPDHLIRDCPAASNPYPFLQTGNAAFHGGMPAYGATYWQGNSFPYVRPYANMYGTPGMLPFDPSIKSMPPFSIPYMSPMYAGLPLSWMGGMGSPMISGAARPLSHTDVIEFQDGEQRRKNLECIEREEAFGEGDDFVEDYHHLDSRRRLNDHKSQLDKGVARSYSDEESPRMHPKHSHEGYVYGSSHQRATSASDDEEIHSGSRKHEKATNVAGSGRDSRQYYSERSHSDQRDVSDSSDQHTREKSKHRHKSNSKKHSEKRGKCSSDYNYKSQSRSWRETCDDRERVVRDHKKHGWNHLSHSEATFALDSSGDQKQSSKEEFSHSSRHSKHKEKSSNDQLEDDRWELVDGLDEVYGSDYRYHKHRRTR